MSPDRLAGVFLETARSGALPRRSFRQGEWPSMREILFRVVEVQPGRLEATSDGRAFLITAPTLEELRLEARELLIENLGAAHVAYRIRLARSRGAANPANQSPETCLCPP